MRTLRWHAGLEFVAVILMPVLLTLIGVLVLMSVLIGGYFYLQWAKLRSDTQGQENED